MALTKGSGFGSAVASGAAGGTVDIVAEGTVTKGISVVLQSNGKVKTIDAIAAGWGDNNYARSNSGNAYACHAGNGRIFVAYRNSSSGNGVAARVGQIDGSAITWGTEISFTGYYCTDIACSVAPSTGHFLIVFTRLSNDYAYRSGGTIGASGTTITSGSTGSFRNNSSFDKDVNYDSKNNKFFVLMRTYQGNHCYVGTATSNTSISSLGSVGNTSSSVLANYSTCEYDSTNERCLMSWKQDNNNTLYACSLDGSNNSLGSQTELGLSNGWAGISHDPTSGKSIFVYNNSSNSNKFTYKVATVSSNSISFGSATLLEDIVASDYKNTFTYDSTLNRHYIHVYDSTNSSNDQIRPYTFDGTTLTALTKVQTDPTGQGPSSLLVNEGKGTIVYCGGNTRSMVFQPESSTLTAGVGTNFIGLSSEDYADGDTATITVIGGVNDGHTGLTTGSVYYVTRAGVLSTTAADTSVRVGTAISSTKILLK